MNNEEKILAILENMDKRLGTLEAGQARLEADVSGLKKGQAKLEETLSQQKEEILDEATHRMKVLLDAEVTPKFNLLAEGQEEILNGMPSEEDMDITDARLKALEAVARKHSKEIAELKKAQ